MHDDELDDSDDCFGPPEIPTLVECIICQNVYESYLMVRRFRIAADGSRREMWSCPTTACFGIGFGRDILPVDRDWADEDGNRMGCGDDDEEDDQEWDEFPPPEGKSGDPPPDEQIPF